MAAVFMLLLSMCNHEAKVTQITFGVRADLSNSTMASYKTSVTWVFSTDNGTTWNPYPIIKGGQSYKAVPTITDPDGNVVQLAAANCFNIDWSTSSPKPSSVDATTGIATFVHGSSDDLIAVVTNTPVSVDNVPGTYTVVQDDWADFKAGDQLTVQKVDDTHVEIVEYPATAFSHAPLVLTITDGIGTVLVEDQDSGSYNASGTQDEHTSGTGSISCNGMINLSLTFKIQGGTYKGNVLSLKKN